mmetsp:Transcript_36582/g.88174  ORF Transcript_36582/g.88174 Transcript_36582/m.88174 type:complete len:287 (+) Transcript_36582:114-974(+)
MPSYFDIDTILAEEELVTVKPKFAFAHLAHLDPDCHRLAPSRKRPRDELDKDNAGGGSSGGHHHLPEGTKIKMPLWAMDRWAMLNFVKIPALPRHYRQRMKERLEADSVSMNLSNKNDHFFLAGTLLTNLLLRAAHVHKRNNAPSSRTSRATDAESQAAERLALEARSLQRSLLTAMMGGRLCRNFDWTLSALDAMEDDVSEWIERLSALERLMFARGVEASGAVKGWREYGCSRMGVSLAVIKGRNMGREGPGAVATGMTPREQSGKTEKKRVVTPVGREAARSF